VYITPANQTLVRPGVCQRHKPLLRNIERCQGSRPGESELRSRPKWLGKSPTLDSAKAQPVGAQARKIVCERQVIIDSLPGMTGGCSVPHTKAGGCRPNPRCEWKGGARVEADDCPGEQTNILIFLSEKRLSWVRVNRTDPRFQLYFFPCQLGRAV